MKSKLILALLALSVWTAAFVVSAQPSGSPGPKSIERNSPFCGIEGRGWFLGLHCFTKYIKVSFFRGAWLRPVPPGESTKKEVRYLDIYENDALDEAQIASWVKQAAAFPGWAP
jgi:hypothetical protein